MSIENSIGLPFGVYRILLARYNFAVRVVLVVLLRLLVLVVLVLVVLVMLCSVIS